MLTILREVRDPRAHNARHDLSALLFIALAASLCGARTCVDDADFGEANAADLAEIVDLPHGVPSHDCFSRVFRLLDADAVTTVLTRFVREIRAGLGLGEPKGVIAVDGKSLRCGYERGRAFMPPLMVSLTVIRSTALMICCPECGRRSGLKRCSTAWPFCPSRSAKVQVFGEQRLVATPDQPVPA